MKKYLIDTNIIDAFHDEEECIVERMQKLDKIKIACISIGELFYGVIKSTQKTKNMNNLTHIINFYEILYIDYEVTYQNGDIKAKLRSIGRPTPDNDIWIAAIAKKHDLVIATRDKHLLDLNFVPTERW